MHVALRTIIRLSVVASLLVAALPVQGDSLGSMAAFEADGATDVTGVLDLLDAREAAALEMAGTVGSVYGWHYETTTWILGTGNGAEIASMQDPRNCDVSTATPTAPFSDCTMITDIASATAPFDHARLSASASSAKNYIRVFSIAEGIDMGVGHELLNGTAAAMVTAPGGVVPKQPYVPAGGVSPENTAEVSRDNSFFTTRTLEKDSVFVQARGNSHILHLKGDFVLEVSGITVNLADGPSTLTFQTGTQKTSTPGLQEESRGFLRLLVSDANLRLTHDDGIMSSVYEGLSLESMTQDLRVSGALGLDVVNSGGAAVVPAPYELGLMPQKGAIQVVEAHEGSTPHASMIGPLASSPTLWTSAATVGAVSLIGYVFYLVRVPALPTIEQALQAGAYRKAARLSTRILRAHPRQESAHLSRAIAWSRAGQHERIVKHVEPFLRRHEPSDGTIHYVLGLAYLDIGREDEARSMMAEAVTRTPSLLAEVEPGLRPSQRLEGHAYT